MEAISLFITSSLMSGDTSPAFCSSEQSKGSSGFKVRRDRLDFQRGSDTILKQYLGPNILLGQILKKIHSVSGVMTGFYSDLLVLLCTVIL